MTIDIDDELLKQMEVTEEDVRIELFARLFDQGRLSFGWAAQLAGVSQDRMHEELNKRGTPRYRYTEQDLERDLGTPERLDAKGFLRTASDDHRQRHVSAAGPGSPRAAGSAFGLSDRGRRAAGGCGGDAAPEKGRLVGGRPRGCSRRLRTRADRAGTGRGTDGFRTDRRRRGRSDRSCTGTEGGPDTRWRAKGRSGCPSCRPGEPSACSACWPGQNGRASSRWWRRC
jgi:predicted HTH domain antitoxin